MRTLVGALGAYRLLAFAFPAAMAATFAVWISGLLVGYALVYLPFVERFAYAPAVPFGSKNFAEALYVSGVSLTMLGFGDVVATGELLRLVTIGEAASGLAAITGGIACVLSVSRLVTGIRSEAVRLAAFGALHARSAARRGRPARARRAAAPPDRDAPAASPLSDPPQLPPGDEGGVACDLLRASIVISLVLRWGVRDERLAFASLYGAGLQTAVSEVIGDYE